MNIKEGYGGKSTSIRVYAREGTRTAEFWVEQDGLMIPLISPKTKKVYIEQQSETLAYITLEELLTLRDELNTVIQELVK